MAIATAGLTDPKPKYDMKYHIIDGEVYTRRHVHTIRMGDVEDPALYAAFPISEWQSTDHGVWVMKNGLDPTFHTRTDYMNYGFTIAITAMISDKRWTEYCLRFDMTHK